MSSVSHQAFCVLFADTEHFSLFLLSLTNYSLFVLQGRWWKKSVLATSSVVIILFLLSPIPDCKAIHQLFLVTEALPPWLCLQHSICLSMLCPLMCTLSLVHWIVWLLLLQTSGGRQNLTFTVELFAHCWRERVEHRGQLLAVTCWSCTFEQLVCLQIWWGLPPRWWMQLQRRSFNILEE